MTPVIFSVLNTNSLLPHGFCINWTPTLLWLYVIADALIFLSYFTIPVILTYFLWRKKNVQFGWVFMLFGAFILACGTSHLLGIVVLWNPIYWIDASMKGVTAVISVITAIAMIRLTPKALSLPTHAQLNQEMQARHQAYEALTEAQTALVESNALLEARVNERTRQLHEKEEYLRIAATAFESQEGIMVTDAKAVILRVNVAFTKITGYSAEEAIGQTPSLLHSGKHGKEFYADMWESINKTGAWAGEIWNRRKNGEIYPEHLSITAVKDTDGMVKNYVASLTDNTMHKEAEDRIEHLAFYDPLTNLPNRRLLMDRITQAMASAERNNRDAAILFLDLDHFKSLNDTLGHFMGDMLLQQVADRLTSCVREGDTVGRLGGDEFVVLLEHLSGDEVEAAMQAEAIGEKILLSLNKPYQLDTHEYQSTPSIGIAIFSDHKDSLEDLLKHADIAMYQAKKLGRNRISFFDPNMQEVINARVDMEHELRKALDLNQFHLHYQIQMGHTGKALGAEALIRWVHPERGLISPFHFIPLAEETGLILPIGQWVLETACAQLKKWSENEATSNLILSINVSAKQFLQSDFVKQVQDAVSLYEIDPTRLKIELTESMLLDKVEYIISTMNTLKTIGIRFSLDDFGTGYSSLQYLKKLPLNQLKIDQSFVRDITTDSSDKAIVITIITMAKSLGLDVIAEGVETEEQRQILQENECHHYQGYLFSKPVPISEFEELLKKN